ncbi:hypothetical protein BaRGS_00011083 [Batillaria attramentaria]|uniref:G-protein coupled receptors family 1 profile domain-containing protein n=1 Tax=Batillaria attramentaria TaxID=370345 RepID=A0ABD0LEP5_9CAEN
MALVIDKPHVKRPPKRDKSDKHIKSKETRVTRRSTEVCADSKPAISKRKLLGEAEVIRDVCGDHLVISTEKTLFEHFWSQRQTIQTIFINLNLKFLNVTQLDDNLQRGYLKRLKHREHLEKATLYIPVIVFLIVLIVTGTLGNLLVCCVYWRKPYKASSHYFILSLAILDLFSCLIGLPTEIADLSFPYIFNMPVACKVLRFTHSSTIIASSTILIQVAFDRYFRICKLGQQFSVRKAKLLHVRYEVLPAADCSTDDSVRGTIYPTIYYLFLFTLFFLTITFFAVLYSRIGVAIWRRKRKTIGSKVVTKMNSHGSDQTSMAWINKRNTQRFPCMLYSRSVT